MIKADFSGVFHRRIDFRRLSLLALVILFGMSFGAIAEQSTTEAVVAPGKTVVTSERLTYDSLKQYAIFDENVFVDDPQIKLYADKLTLFFHEDGSAKNIRAEGNVRISQNDVVAQAAQALYDIPSGRIILSGKPVVTKGDDTLTGNNITFWRDQNKMIVDGRAKLVISPEEDGSAKQLLGEF